jgi:hypothetical protein
VTRDEVFVPHHQEPSELESFLRQSPLFRLGHILFQQLLGW